MHSNSTFHLAPPQHLYDSYKAIKTSNLILNKSLDEENIVELQTLLNASQPTSNDEVMSRSLIQYLYRKNPTNFCRYLVRSRLSHLILWTEAKCIVRHFGLQGVVYVKWDDMKYECSLHRNVNNTTQGDMEHPAIQRTVDSVTQNHNGYNNRQTGRGRPSGGRRNVYNASNETDFPALHIKNQTCTPVNSPYTPSRNVVNESDVDNIANNMAGSFVLDGPSDTTIKPCVNTN